MKKSFYFLSIFFGVTIINANCYVTGVASYDTLSVRVSSTSSSKKVGELASHASGINVLYCKRKSYSSPWCKISYTTATAKIVGWVNSRYLYCPQTTSYCVDKVARNDTLSVRIRPNYKSTKVGELSPYADGITKIKCIKHWCKIKYLTYDGNTIIGWVNSKFLSPCEPGA